MPQRIKDRDEAGLALPRLIVIGGLSGTGKSALAQALAPVVPPAPGAVVLRADIERKAMFGVAATERLPPAAYRLEITAAVYARLVAQAAHALAGGRAVIVDAVYARADERAAIAAVATACAVPFQGLFLVADLATRLARIGARSADASDADAAVARAQETYDLGDLAWPRLGAGGSREATRAAALAALGLPPSHAADRPTAGETAGCLSVAPPP